MEKMNETICFVKGCERRKSILLKISIYLKEEPNLSNRLELINAVVGIFDLLECCIEQLVWWIIFQQSLAS